MWCIATGSERTAPGGGGIKVSRIIEYLNYDFSNHWAEICADCIVFNEADRPLELRILHRGNVSFRNTTANVKQDTRYTPIGRQLIGLPDQEPTPATCAPLTRIHAPSDGDCFVPFSLYRTAPLDPGVSSLVRIEGRLEGRSYRRLLYGRCADAEQIYSKRMFLSIYGGDILIKSIEQEDLLPDDDSPDDLNVYRDLLYQFKTEHMDCPDAYHVLLDAVSEDGQQLRISALTPDLHRGRENYPFGERRITHYWSKSSLFHVRGTLNGMKMVVETTK